MNQKSLSWSGSCFTRNMNWVSVCVVMITDTHLFLKYMSPSHRNTLIFFSVRHGLQVNIMVSCSEFWHWNSVTSVKKPVSVCCLLLSSDKSDIFSKTRLNGEQWGFCLKSRVLAFPFFFFLHGSSSQCRSTASCERSHMLLTCFSREKHSNLSFQKRSWQLLRFKRWTSIWTFFIIDLSCSTFTVYL